MDKISTNQIVKIGIIVKDIEQAARTYAALFSIPVPEVKTPNPNAVPPANASTWYRGADKAAKCRTAIIRLEPIYIELIEPLEGASPWSEFKEEHGQGVHYLAFNVEGFQDHIDLLNAAGMPVYYKQDKGKERYAYFETAEKLGITLEFKEIDKE